MPEVYIFFRIKTLFFHKISTFSTHLSFMIITIEQRTKTFKEHYPSDKSLSDLNTLFHISPCFTTRCIMHTKKQPWPNRPGLFFSNLLFALLILFPLQHIDMDRTLGTMFGAFHTVYAFPVSYLPDIHWALPDTTPTSIAFTLIHYHSHNCHFMK